MKTAYSIYTQNDDNKCDGILFLYRSLVLSSVSPANMQLFSKIDGMLLHDLHREDGKSCCFRSTM